VSELNKMKVHQMNTERRVAGERMVLPSRAAESNGRLR